MDDFIVNKDEDNFTFFGFADEDEESTYIGDDVHKATNTKPFQVDYISALLYILCYQSSCVHAGHQRRQSGSPEGARGQVRAARDQEPLRTHPSRGGVLQEERRRGRIAYQVSQSVRTRTACHAFRFSTNSNQDRG